MRFIVACASVIALAVVTVGLFPVHASADRDDMVSRGRYLTNDGVKCVDCHGARLQGMQLGFMRPGMPIAYYAPKIAGLPMLSQPAAVRFFQTGLLPGGGRARPPMPQFRFSRSDAQAITAYLRSLR
ncbi:MAG: c-type cytochrome [Candidatus Eremiobacter antarcticus]|nr:hypothetical protein [Candidatus Eremiobacteraeota bacterium]MBC5807112.1 hypothetical protein [Candidatus Eremiobacteraeota bacterium]